MTVQGITESDTTEPACFKNNKSSISVGDSRSPHCHKATDQHASQVKPQPPSVPAASRGDPVSGPVNDQNLGNITVCKLCTENTMGLGWGTKRVKLAPVGLRERRRRQEKGTTEDEIVGWHLDSTYMSLSKLQGDGEGQVSLACCSPWGRKESDKTERLN